MFQRDTTALPATWFERIMRFWVYGGAIAALVLIALVPFFWSTLPPAALVVYLGLPLYMLHQLEEHDHDRFEHFINTVLFNGRDILTYRAIFYINILLVWAWFVIVLYLTVYIASTYALLALYPVGLNALFHLVALVHLRRYNPGVVTALLLLLPYSICGMWYVYTQTALNLTDHLFGLAAAFMIHGIVIGHVLLQNLIQRKH